VRRRMKFFVKRIYLFLRLVWRRWEPENPQSRIDWRTACDVAGIVWGWKET